MSEPEKSIDWKYCFYCKGKVNILGDQFCSDYCVQQYNIEKHSKPTPVKPQRRNFD